MTDTDHHSRYKSLLLAMCKYHQNLKDESTMLREMAKDCKDEDPGMSFGLNRKANLLSEQRKAILWMLNRRRPELEEFFGTFVVETIATHELYEEALKPVETVQASRLGVPKRDEDGRLVGKCSNWRMAQLDL